jgi:uncharacterized protein YbaP (TraB family)
MRSLRTWSWLLALISLALPSVAQDNAWEKTFLWQVQKGENKLYLLGGLSVGKRGFYPMPQAVTQALRDSDVVILESDLADGEGAERALKLGIYGSDDSLDKHLPRDLYEEVFTVALNYDMPEAQLRAMRPWMFYFQTIYKEFSNAGYTSDYATELVIYALAKGLDKEVGALEAADASAKYLNAMPAELQESMLRGLLTELKDDGVVKGLAALWKAMRQGDAPAFIAAMQASEKLYPNAEQLRETLFYARQPAMLEKIEGYLASGKKHLVVVGAVNLLGERSLVEALRKKGYDVNPL